MSHFNKFSYTKKTISIIFLVLSKLLILASLHSTAKTLCVWVQYFMIGNSGLESQRTNKQWNTIHSFSSIFNVFLHCSRVQVVWRISSGDDWILGIHCTTWPLAYTLKTANKKSTLPRCRNTFLLEGSLWGKHFIQISKNIPS